MSKQIKLTPNRTLAKVPFAVGEDARTTKNKLKQLMKTHNISSCSALGMKFSGSTTAFRIEDATDLFIKEFCAILGENPNIFDASRAAAAV